MRKFISTTFVLALGLVFYEAFARRDGTDPGYTGSPGDGYKNCTTCHGGTATLKFGWITSNIPKEGYEPGKIYTIKATNITMGATRFGFAISPQALNGALLGTLIVTDTSRTKLVGFDKYLTYKSDGVDGIDSNSWTFDWKAPAVGSGNVTFYGAFNSNPGHKSSDGTTLSTLEVKEFGTTGIQDLPSGVSAFSVYPNPANDHVSINLDLKETANLLIDVADITGKQVAIISNEKQTGIITKQFSTAALPNGNYFVRLQVNGKTATQKLTVSH